MYFLFFNLFIMRNLSIASIVGVLLINICFVYADNGNETALRSPQCVQDLIRTQVDMVN